LSEALDKVTRSGTCLLRRTMGS